MRADHSCHCVRRPEHHPPSRSNRVRRRVRDKPAIQHRRSPGSRETGASSGGRNPAEQHPIPIHPLGAPWPPRSIQGKMLIGISESRRPRRNSVRYPVNAGLSLVNQEAVADQRCPSARTNSTTTKLAIATQGRRIVTLATVPKSHAKSATPKLPTTRGSRPRRLEGPRRRISDSKVASDI